MPRKRNLIAPKSIKNPFSLMRYIAVRVTLEEEVAIKSHLTTTTLPKTTWMRRALMNQLALERKGNPVARIEHKVDQLGHDLDQLTQEIKELLKRNLGGSNGGT